MDGPAALLRIAGRDAAQASAYDLAFVVGPRLNAAGRLSDMSLGIECLITDDEERALTIARELDALNRQRRAIEADMRASALAALSDDPGDACSLVLFDPEWHQGVIGIVASRLKERFHRPALAFARGVDGEIKGSGRSIAGLHLRDALDLVSKRYPGLLLRFGGHAAAAGLTLRERDFSLFRSAFEATVSLMLTPQDLEREIHTDGSLPLADCTFAAAVTLHDGVWGQGFPEPSFFDTFEVREQRIVGGEHMKLKLGRGGRAFDAMLFQCCEELPPRVDAVYRLDLNDYNGTRGLQLTVQHWRAAS